MKKVKRRTASVMLLVLLIVAGVVFYVGKYIVSGSKWVTFASNWTVYDDGVLKVGTVLDRNGVTLAAIDNEGRRVYADDWQVRRATFHAVGDVDENIGTGALSAFAAELIGYNPVFGAYSIDGKGGEVKLSIDADLCTAAYDALGGLDGTIGIFNYETGEIICMVSSPTYDPMEPPSEEELEEYDGVYINRMLSSTFTPGSIFKLVTAAAAIENIPDIYERTFVCEGTMQVEGDEIKCTGTHGEISFEDALAHSCNCAFGEISMELGPKILSEYVEKYGLTSSVEIDGITTAAGEFDSAEYESANLAWSGIGQYNDLVNPCAMMRFVGAIANNGEAVDMTLLAKGKLASMTKTNSQRIISEDTARQLKNMMNYNVYLSYGQENFPGLELYAKSGTAEMGEDVQPHAWFVGFVENEGCPFAFVVFAENGGWGSSVAGSIANTIMQRAVNG